MCTTSKGEGVVLSSIFATWNTGCGLKPWNIPLTSNFNSRFRLWSLLNSVSFLLFESKSLFAIKRSVRTGKRGSCDGPSTRMGYSGKLGVGGLECSAV